jgi:hypothetical protein
VVVWEAFSRRGVFTVIFRFAGRFFPWRRGGALVLIAVATMAYGCGSSNDGSHAPTSGGGKLVKQVKEEDLYRYEGTGKAKRKVAISRQERVKLLHEAAKKSE